MDSRTPAPNPRTSGAQDTMEHRWSPRKSCDFSIRLRAKNSSTREFRVTNANRNGLRIDTGSIHLTPGSIVELELKNPITNEVCRTLYAMVIHAAPGSAGLWLGDDLDQSLKLQELIADSQD